MHKLLLSILLLVLISIGFTQTYKDYEDVVILKNGTEIHGIIIEQKPYEYIKIQSGKNIFEFEFDEIELFKKELIAKNKSKELNKKWGLELGYSNFSLSLSKNYSDPYYKKEITKIKNSGHCIKIGITRNFELLSNNFQLHYTLMTMISELHMPPSGSYFINYQLSK